MQHWKYQDYDCVCVYMRVCVRLYGRMSVDQRFIRDQPELTE